MGHDTPEGPLTAITAVRHGLSAREAAAAAAASADSAAAAAGASYTPRRPHHREHSSRATASAPSAMDIARAAKLGTFQQHQCQQNIWNANGLAGAFTAARYKTFKFLSSHDIVAITETKLGCRPGHLLPSHTFHSFPARDDHVSGQGLLLAVREEGD